MKNEKRTIRDWGICILSFCISCSTLFSSTIFYSLKLITNRTSEFFTIFVIRESTKKDRLKTWRGFLRVLVCSPYVTGMYSHVNRMSLVYTRMSSVSHSYVLECHPYVTRIYSYVICMSLVYTRVSSVCHSYILVCHPYVTRTYSYVIRMSLVYTRMSSVRHSYILVCHPYVTRTSLVYIRMSSVCHPYVVLP